MRRLIELVLFFSPLIAILVVLYFLVGPIRQAERDAGQEITPKQAQAKHLGNLAYAITRVDELQKLKLIFNSNSEEIGTLLEANQCRSGINGGFYDLNLNPLGLLEIEGQHFSDHSSSELLNGYVYLTEGGLRIEDSLPEESYLFILQSGPLLFYEESAQDLAIVNDKHSRRSLIAQAIDKRVYLISVYDPNSVFSGPYLDDLPKIVDQIQQRERIDFENALNLDGGSASFFLKEGLFLNEYRTVRSLFCVTS